MKTKKWALMAGVSVLCTAVLLAAAGIASAKASEKNNKNDPSRNPDSGVIGVAPPNDGTEEDIFLAAPTVDFNARYIRTNGYREDVKYPVVKIIRSVGELNAYYEANKEGYSLGRNDNVYSDTTIGFLDACDKYDDAYFEDHILIMVLLEEGSGSIRHEVQSVNVSADGQCCIYIDRIVPEVGTCDMAEWHILIEPEAGIEIEKESDITVFVDSVDPLAQPELVRFGRGYANISLSIPDGWEYETEVWTDSEDFSITFWPAGRSEGKIRVRYYGGRFGVCGTGLEQEKISFWNYEAWMGTYDNHKVWDFIRLIGTPGDYVIINEGASQWWDEYGGEAMRILSTLVVGDGYISEAEAIATAKEEATVEYDQTWAYYNSENGLWTVTLFKEYATGVCDGYIVGERQDVTITCEGKVIDIQCGE